MGFVADGQPFVIPTIHARIDDKIILHGSAASHMLKHIQSGNEVCIAITILDGLVLARSVFHHSMNYRSVVLYGNGILITDNEAKLEAAKAISEHIMPERWDDVRPPNQKELDSTTFVTIKIKEATAKIRTGPPADEEEDYQLSVWAGVIPITLVKSNPVSDSMLAKKIKLPDYLDY